MRRLKDVPFEMDINGRIVTAHYVVDGNLVRARLDGRWSEWNQIGGLPAVHVAEMLVRDMLRGKAA